MVTDTLPVVALYAGWLIVFQTALSIRTVAARNKSGISFGWGDDAGLAKVVRAHGNFAEYVPLTLLVMALAALMGADRSFLHGVGGLLAFGRIAHALGLYREFLPARVVGQVCTWAAMLAAGALVLI